MKLYNWVVYNLWFYNVGKTYDILIYNYMLKSNIFLLMQDLKSATRSTNVDEDTLERKIIKHVFRKVKNAEATISQLEYIESLLLDRERLITLLLGFGNLCDDLLFDAVGGFVGECH